MDIGSPGADGTTRVVSLTRFANRPYRSECPWRHVSNESRRPLGGPDTITPVACGPVSDRDWCADEVGIDFPSLDAAVARIRDSMSVDEDRLPVRAEIRLSPREAFDGIVVPLDVPVRRACPLCGGRGETWMEPCAPCAGTGESLFHHRVRLSVPPRVADGARFRFKISSPLALPTRVEVRVAIA